MMQITFHGAAKTVTGSQHLLHINGKRILLDSGLYQGQRKDMVERNRKFPFDVRSIDAVILSHAHIDHSGNIPNLVKRGFKGDIFTTHATRDLCASMLPDSGYIQERNAEFANKHRRKGEAKAEPIYTEADARRAIRYFRSIPLHQTIEIFPNIRLTLIEAGHMLGSAMVILDFKEEYREHWQRLVFTGDVGRDNIPIIRSPEVPDYADYLIMESTYGGRTHEPYSNTSEQLRQVILDTYECGGVILIPAFAVGRTQQIVVQLNELFERDLIPKIPVYVDSPLAIDATTAFRKHPECWDYELETFIYESGDDDPFGFETLHYVRELNESKSLNYRQEPMIIISASGMMEFGRVVHHIKNRITDKRNALLITGWQAPNTLGRKMADGAPYVKIFGQEYKNKIRTVVMDGFSGHADHNELLNWFDRIKSKPKQVFLVHGEEEAATELSNSLQENYNLQVHIPNLNEKFEIG